MSLTFIVSDLDNPSHPRSFADLCLAFDTEEPRNGAARSLLGVVPKTGCTHTAFSVYLALSHVVSYRLMLTARFSSCR